MNHLKSDVDVAQLVTREYALYCMGRFVSQTVGEHAFYGKGTLGYGKACESAKSNALTRCCKDLGIASELWDPQVGLCVYIFIFTCAIMRYHFTCTCTLYCNSLLTSGNRTMLKTFGV